MTKMDEEDKTNWPHLHVFMPDFERQNGVIVGRPCRLQVFMTPPKNGDTKYAIDYVDVIVLASGFKVNPLRQKLPLPINPDSIAEFELTAKSEGKFDVCVLLLIMNQSIHSQEFTLEARMEYTK